MSQQDTTGAILLAAYAAQNQSATAARRIAYQVIASIPGLQQAATPPTSGSITLSLEQSTTPTSGARVFPTSYGPGTQSKTQTQGAALTTLRTITFDVALDANAHGFAQSIQYTSRARQSIHNTPGGFYVDEFGMAPGSLTIEAIIAARDGIVSRISAFSDMLASAKLTNPLNPAPACILRYINSVDGRAMLLTQSMLSVSQVAGDPGLARVSLQADVLQDYTNRSSSANAKTTSAPGANVSSLIGAAVGAVGGILGLH